MIRKGLYRLVPVAALATFWQSSFAMAALVAHYDADQIASNPTTNTYADQWDGVFPEAFPGTNDNWTDLSGNGYDLERAGNDPFFRGGSETQAINGNAVVDFYAGANQMRVPGGVGFTGDQAHTVFVVARLDEDGDNVWGTVFGFSNDLTTVREGYTFAQANISGSDLQSVVMESGFGDNLTFSLGAAASAPLIVEFRYAGGGWNGTNMNVYVNGAAVTVSGGSGLPMAFSAEDFSVNWSFRSPDFHLGELRIYNTALSTAERNAVGFALAQEYGITTQYVPEPSSLSLLALGLASLGLFRRRR